MALVLHPEAVRCTSCLVVQYCSKGKCRYCGAKLPEKPKSAPARPGKLILMPAPMRRFAA